MARYYRHPAHAHRALLAGATWAQVAAATGRDEGCRRYAAAIARADIAAGQ